MARRSLTHSILIPAAQFLNRRSPSSCPVVRRRSSTLCLLPFTTFFTPYSTASASTSSSTLDYAQALRLRDLRTTLNSDGSPSEVWTAYTSLLTVIASDYVPLDLHQEVLRRCTPSISTIRETLVSKLSQSILPKFVHSGESHFRAILQNIYSQGAPPCLDDFNFVLQHYAAVGYYEGCSKLYQEIIRHSSPSSITIGYCLQAIACRFSFPIPSAKRDPMAAEASALVSSYLKDMRKYNVALNSTTFELVVRILKETLDLGEFERLMRWGYGIDLSNPDRIALEYADPSSSEHGTLSTPLPFTTATLNTTLDVLGRLGQLPKMIQAFEVLTQPLPQASQHFFNSFEDDDFGVNVDVGSSTPFLPPHAKPNTTTYNIMLRYIGWADHATFARHYILQARELSSATVWKLRHQVKYLRHRKLPLDTLPSPQFAITAGLLTSVLGQANKDKNLGLMKWLQTKMPYFIRAKTKELEYFSSVLAEMHSEGLVEFPPPSPSPIRSLPTLELDVENPRPMAESFRPFDINRHVEILKRDLFEIQQFVPRLEFTIGRTYQRTKERLGRRVWNNQNIFLLDVGRRTHVSREEWQERVNFKPRNDNYDYQDRSKPWSVRKPRQINKKRLSTAAWACVGLPPKLLVPPLPVNRTLVVCDAP